MKLQNHKIKITGFTIVELIVTTGIFALITSMMLIRDAKFNSTVKLNNLTYEVALAVRQAQIFGTGVKEYGSGDFNVGYGVHFDTANNKSFVFFADANKNNIYDGTSEIIEVVNMRGNNFINKFCIFSLNGNETCSNTGSKLDILFKRPNHNAIISSDIVSGLNESARIYISSTDGDEKSVLVKFVGQISVE
ncbi:MAG: type II secretion system protein [Patescibacteria group bacterium]